MQHGWLVLIGVGAYWLYNRMNQPMVEMPLQQPAPIPQSTVQPPASGPRYVEVGQGDTMLKIASAYGLSLADMAVLNHILIRRQCSQLISIIIVFERILKRCHVFTVCILNAKHFLKNAVTI